MHRDRRYPHTSVKGSRRSSRTSAGIRARDWYKSWRMYVDAKELLCDGGAMPRFADSKEIVANEDVDPIDVQYQIYRRQNYERIVFLNLTGTCKHYCPEWDFMAIDETCPEFDSCTCGTFPNEKRTRS